MERQTLRTGGQLWGPRRVRAGVSLRQLAEASGVSRGLLSLMETGRMVPTGDEYDRVTEALSRLGPGPDISAVIGSEDVT